MYVNTAQGRGVTHWPLGGPFFMLCLKEEKKREAFEISAKLDFAPRNPHTAARVLEWKVVHFNLFSVPSCCGFGGETSEENFGKLNHCDICELIVGLHYPG